MQSMQSDADGAAGQRLSQPPTANNRHKPTQKAVSLVTGRVLGETSGWRRRDQVATKGCQMQPRPPSASRAHASERPATAGRRATTPGLNVTRSMTLCNFVRAPRPDAYKFFTHFPAHLVFCWVAGPDAGGYTRRTQDAQVTRSYPQERTAAATASRGRVAAVCLPQAPGECSFPGINGSERAESQRPERVQLLGASARCSGCVPAH